MITQFDHLPPLSLYIHIPWCIKKCPYCDFNSHALKQQDQTLPEQQYLSALFQDLDSDLTFVQGRKLHSIFLGGGTPSLLSASALEKILSHMEKNIGFEDDIEITLEANPGTFEYQKFADFKTAGINRLSIGVQSFDNEQLKKLGRVHEKKEAIAAAEAAHKLGLNFNLDLMHGLPGQTVRQALNDIQRAIDLEAAHISWYQLTIEANTAYYQNPPLLPPEDTLFEIQQEGVELLRKAQFQHYEISAYAKAGKQSKHNLNYWQFGDYLGIGAGAHGKITSLEKQVVYRTSKTRLPQHYMARDEAFNAKPFYSQEHVPQAELTLEFMMNALRLCRGVPNELFAQRTGQSLDTIVETLVSLRGKDLLTNDTHNLCASPLGLQYLNELLGHFSR